MTTEAPNAPAPPPAASPAATAPPVENADKPAPADKPEAAPAPAVTAPPAVAKVDAPIAPAAAPTVVAPKPSPFPLLPSPAEIPPGEPDDPADPPGLVPPGDSRSLRRAGEFVLVYRQANIVVSRFGAVGKRGQFRVVEYPTSAYAANAYARECSRWVSEGYADYREP